MAEQQALSWEARVFAQKTARSISEIQQSVNNMADVVVFLEVLGYDDNTAKKNGFENLYDLAKYVYNFVDVYDDEKNSKEELVKTFSLPVPSTRKRIAESLSMIFPWLGSLVLLFVTGVSLWMAWGLPADVTTAFLAGVFLGLVVTEGLLQNYQRLFSFYYSQTNIGEVKRSIKRSYLMAAAILAAAVSAVFGAATVADIPLELAAITAISAVTISLHRTSYLIMYSLKKLAHLFVSYLGAFAIIFIIYFATPELIPDVTTRYFAALGSAFALLSVFAAYHHYRIIGRSSTSIVAKDAPHFYSPLTVNDNTIPSRFGVQLWECMPYFLFGTFYFAILFSDRVISWIFNPDTVVAANGTVLPLAFNSVYHIGADLALLVILPAAVIQYVMTGPIYALAHNRAVSLKVSQMKQIDKFLQNSYMRLLAATAVSSIATAVLLNFIGPQIIDYMDGSETSLNILGYASAANVLLSIFAANGIFMIFLGRVKTLAIISIASALVVVAGGMLMAPSDIQNAVLAYLAATVLAFATSTAYMVKISKNAGSRLFARYI